MWFDQYAGHCIVSNFRLLRDWLSQITTAAETPSAPTLARSNLICLLTVDWPSWLLLPAVSALSCHHLADHWFSLHIADQHWRKLCHPVFHLWSSFASHTHLLLLRLGFSTKPHQQCLHFTRVCGLCQHPSLSNPGNKSGHHLAGSNKTRCWSSFVNFVASFLSVQFCHPCHLPSYSRWLCPLIRLDLKLIYAFESVPCLLRTHQPLCILHWSFYKTPYVVCVHR